jgi:dihydroxyacetone kinase-like protein
MNGAEVRSSLIQVARVIESHQARLCELDSQVGDGDHGVSMTIGMRAARRGLEKLSDPTPQQAFRCVGLAFGDEVGASSGVLYEVGFVAAADFIGERSCLATAAEWGGVLQAIASAIQKVGRVELGDKTMFDAWQPAADAALAGARDRLGAAAALQKAAAAGWAGVARTKELIPKKGRASLLGERARGHEDAGATSASLIIEALCHCVMESEAEQS